MPRPLRFGLSFTPTRGGADTAERLRVAEHVGYSTVQFPDHLGSAAPLVSAAFAAAATERLRLGTFVINHDFRHLALLAQEVATLDLLSDGRAELGVGAGHMKQEFDAAGITFDSARIRIERLEEAIPLLRRLLAGEAVTYEGEHLRLANLTGAPVAPQGRDLPILIGGNGDRLLSVAARLADIVGFTGFRHPPGAERVETSHFTHEGLTDRIAHVRREADGRFDELELNILVQRLIVTDDRDAAFSELIGRGWPESVADSPFVLAGTVDAIASSIEALRERHGISYFTFFEDRSEGAEDVVTRLAKQ